MIQVILTDDEARALVANCDFGHAAFEAMGVKSEYPSGLAPRDTAVQKLTLGLLRSEAARSVVVN